MKIADFFLEVWREHNRPLAKVLLGEVVNQILFIITLLAVDGILSLGAIYGYDADVINTLKTADHVAMQVIFAMLVISLCRDAFVLFFYRRKPSEQSEPRRTRNRR